MDTEVLRWFRLVAEGVTVTEVADLHLVSQPGVSRALARLEEEVGTPLLRRSGRVLAPTHAGSVFKRHVDEALDRLDDGLAAVGELLDPERGTVTVAFQLSLGTWLVPEMVAEFRADHPGVRFRLEQSHDAHGSSPLAGGRIDLEFTSRRPDDPSVQWELLLAEPLRLAVPATHRLAELTEAGLADVADEDFVMLRRSWDLRARCDDLCAAAGFTPRVAFEGDDIPVVRGLVAAGLGVAIVPQTRAESGFGPDGERLVRLRDPGAFREVGLAWSRERRLLPSAEEFRAHVLARWRPGETLGHDEP